MMRGLPYHALAYIPKDSPLAKRLLTQGWTEHRVVDDGRTSVLIRPLGRDAVRTSNDGDASFRSPTDTIASDREGCA